MSIFHVTAIATLLLLMLVLIIPVYLTSTYLISYRSYFELSGFKIELQPVLLYYINKIVDSAYTCTIPDVDLLTATTNKLHTLLHILLQLHMSTLQPLLLVLWSSKLQLQVDYYQNSPWGYINYNLVHPIISRSFYV